MRTPRLLIGHGAQGLPRDLGLGLEWRGPKGLEELRRTVECSTLDPTTFYARIDHLRRDGLRVFDWSSTEMWGFAPGRPGSAAVDLGLVLAGGARITTNGVSWTASAGELYVLRQEDARAWAFQEGTSIRTAVFGEAEPARIEAPTPGLVQPTPLSAAFAALLHQMGDDPHDSRRDERSTVVRALAHGLLDERRH